MAAVAVIGLGIIIGEPALPLETKIDKSNQINTEMFRIESYEAKICHTEGGWHCDVWPEYKIVYGPEKGFDQLPDYFLHPVPEVSEKGLNCKDNRWQLMRYYSDRNNAGYKLTCLDMLIDNIPEIISFVREKLEDNINLTLISYYWTDGYAELHFHPDMNKDETKINEFLDKLKNSS